MGHLAAPRALIGHHRCKNPGISSYTSSMFVTGWVGWITSSMANASILVRFWPIAIIRQRHGFYGCPRLPGPPVPRVAASEINMRGMGVTKDFYEGIEYLAELQRRKHVLPILIVGERTGLADQRDDHMSKVMNSCLLPFSQNAQKRFLPAYQSSIWSAWLRIVSR